MIKKLERVCLFLICCFCHEYTCIKMLPEYNLQEGKLGDCDLTIVDLPSVLVRSHVGAGLFGGLNNYQADQECAVTFQTKTGYKVLVQFSFFELQPKDGGTCKDKIVLTEKGTGSTKETTLCTKEDFISETEKIEMKFISDSSTEGKGFVAVVTSFREGTCSGSEFKCDTARCISSDLKCDGHDHCIDKADENKELAGCSIFDEVINKVTGLGKYGLLAIAVVAGGVFLAIFISVILWKYLKRDGKCCECSDANDDENDGRSDSQYFSDHGKMASKSKKGGAARPSGKSSTHTFTIEDNKPTKKIKVKGKVDPDIEW